VWHDSFICVTWRIHMWDMTHLYVWHDSLICVTWLIHLCDMTHSYVWHDAFICVTWLIHMCVMTHSYVSTIRLYDLFIYVFHLTAMRGHTKVVELFLLDPIPINAANKFGFYTHYYINKKNKKIYTNTYGTIELFLLYTYQHALPTNSSFALLQGSFVCVQGSFLELFLVIYTHMYIYTYQHALPTNSSLALLQGSFVCVQCSFLELSLVIYTYMYIYMRTNMRCQQSFALLQGSFVCVQGSFLKLFLVIYTYMYIHTYQHALPTDSGFISRPSTALCCRALFCVYKDSFVRVQGSFVCV